MNNYRFFYFFTFLVPAISHSPAHTFHLPQISCIRLLPQRIVVRHNTLQQSPYTHKIKSTLKNHWVQAGIIAASVGLYCGWQFGRWHQQSRAQSLQTIYHSHFASMQRRQLALQLCTRIDLPIAATTEGRQRESLEPSHNINKYGNWLTISPIQQAPIKSNPKQQDNNDDDDDDNDDMPPLEPIPPRNGQGQQTISEIPSLSPQPDRIHDTLISAPSQPQSIPEGIPIDNIPPRTEEQLPEFAISPMLFSSQPPEIVPEEFTIVEQQLPSTPLKHCKSPNKLADHLRRKERIQRIQRETEQIHSEHMQLTYNKYENICQGFEKIKKEIAQIQLSDRRYQQQFNSPYRQAKFRQTVQETMNDQAKLSKFRQRMKQDEACRLDWLKTISKDPNTLLPELDEISRETDSLDEEIRQLTRERLQLTASGYYSIIITNQRDADSLNPEMRQLTRFIHYGGHSIISPNDTMTKVESDKYTQQDLADIESTDKLKELVAMDAHTEHLLINAPLPQNGRKFPYINLD